MPATSGLADVIVTDEILHTMLADAIDATATNDGQWRDLGPYRANASLHFVGMAGAAVFTLAGSNAKTQPADTANGTAIGATVTADGWVALSNPPRFLKVRLTTAGTGTPSVGYVGSRQR